ncbi:P-loop containing nucleoside triphosphate hydrolase protein [Cantharellus anzutake]|uniref:P-loop containing nucleoside triphosphate hydrolase protein n=1 Tax=Cantharellus anzutake TaxID=1750568 RepID=UPI0019077AF4|nr:P-loop containing nucleoside triphosphate hydrolase protein [Cantharellus anzutake]KAF8329525.1 P-loop containing nucleoside triphosphate hydrolase protein [Cantharellus anzutake]
MSPIKRRENPDPRADAPGPIQGPDEANHVPFSSLKDRISYDTFKAITIKPFYHTHMTPVQHAVLSLLPELARPYILSDPDADDENKLRLDVLCKSKTGTGKTLAFLVPAIEARIASIDAYAKQALVDAGKAGDKHMEGRIKRGFVHQNVGTVIISPTRELATQIANEAIRLSHHHGGFEVRLFVGGMGRKQQMRDWMKGRRDIVVATPGRLRDLLENEPDVANGIKKSSQLILDEADTLLDMGFRSDLDAILGFFPPPPERQTFMFSATISTAVRQVARQFLKEDHTFIDTVPKNESPVHAHIPQHNTILPGPEHQIPHLLRLIAHDQLTNPGKSKVMVFLNTTRMAQLFASLLREVGKGSLPAANTKIYEIHSRKDMNSRISTSSYFRKDMSGATVLVTSDVSARGIDYPGVTRVIQMGTPGSTEQYIHRVGRTGRGGSVGGRADIVALPWEAGFLTWQLQDIPLKNVTIKELEGELLQLAQAHDANPVQPERKLDEKFKLIRGGTNFRSAYSSVVFPPNVAERITAGMKQTVDEALSRVDVEMVRETFASMLGYYIPKNHELRINKNAVVEGVKLWATGAMRLLKPPFVSTAFLNRLGLSDARTNAFNRSSDSRGLQSRGSGSPDTPRWSGRGQFKLRAKKEDPTWSRTRRDGFDSRDPGPPARIGTRFGQKHLTATAERNALSLQKSVPPHLAGKIRDI